MIVQAATYSSSWKRVMTSRNLLKPHSCRFMLFRSKIFVLADRDKFVLAQICSLTTHLYLLLQAFACKNVHLKLVLARQSLFLQQKNIYDSICSYNCIRGGLCSFSARYLFLCILCICLKKYVLGGLQTDVFSCSWKWVAELCIYYCI